MKARWDYLADDLIQAGMVAECRALLEKVHAGSLNAAQTGYLACYYRELGDIERALALFRSARVLEPDNAVIANNYGIALLEHGDPEAACAMFELAIQRNPAAHRYVLLSAALEQMDRSEEALGALRKAVELDPSFDEAVCNLAEQLMDSDPADARQVCEEGIAHCPESSDIMERLGTACRRTGDHERGRIWFERCIERDPDNYWALVHLGNLAYFRNHLLEARHFFERAVAVCDDDLTRKCLQDVIDAES